MAQGQKEHIKLDKTKYQHGSIRERIEALFLDNLGKVITREQIIEVAKDPRTGKEPENWHQRLSELRTDAGYTIHSHRDRRDLSLQEYVMPSAVKRASAAKRVLPTKTAWAKVLLRANGTCEWSEGGPKCGLRDGDIDPVGGGTVRLTPDHKAPHSVNPASDPDDENAWQALCARHQVVKKNFWDNTTGNLNYHALIQAAGKADKQLVFEFLLDHYGFVAETDGSLKKIARR
jgi:hypothetical protein